MYKNYYLRTVSLVLSILMVMLMTTACKKDKGGNESVAGNGATINSNGTADTSGDGFNFTHNNDVDNNIGINNSDIDNPNVNSNSAGASIVNRTEVEGVAGSFKDVTLKESVRDLKGKKIIFGAHYPQNYSATGNSDAQRCYAALKAIEKDYNCKIEVVQFDGTANGAKEIATAKASGKVLYNVIELLANTSNQILKTSGLAADLRKVSTVGVESNPWNPAFTLLSSYKSKVLGVGVRYDRFELNILFFNKNLASKYQLGDFYEMVRTGKWTTENFISICEKFREKSGGNMYAVESMYPQTYLTLMYTNWTSPLAIANQNGKNSYIFNGTDSKILDVMSICQDAVKKGLFNPQYEPSTVSNGIYKQAYSDYKRASNAFINGKSLFFIGSNGDAVLPHIYTNSVDDYGIIPLPMGSSANNYSTVITNGLYYSLLDGNPDIENDGAILTAIANRTNIKVADIQAHNKTLVRDSQSHVMLTQNYKFKQILNIEMSVGDISGIFYGAAVPSILAQQSTPKQAMESISNKMKTEINRVYGQ